MALALLITGLVMNAAGIVLGSSRDLTSLGRSVSNRVRAWPMAFVAALRSLWNWMRRKPRAGNVYSVGGGVTAATSSASGSAFLWNDIPDGLSAEEATSRLRSRTEALREMLAAESKRHTEDVERLSGDAKRSHEVVENRLVALEQRIDDFDVKPAGQRGLGALLVICGTVMMFAAGLLA